MMLMIIMMMELSGCVMENCKLTALLTQLEQKIQRKRVNKINTKSSNRLDSTRLDSSRL